MAGGSRAIVIRFLGNTQGLNNQLTAAQRRMQSFRRSVAVGAAGAGAALAVFGKQAIQVASDTAEATSKSQNVFGAWTATVNDFAATSAKSFGISKRAALDYTGAMGSVLVAQGFTQQSAAGLALQYTKLAADLASFNNTSIEDAAAALQASLTGEFEQLKKYGIVINDVRLAQEAQKEGMTKAGATWTQAQKNQLAYNIVLHDTAQAQGDFGRTAGGLANQQRILAAQVDDLQGKIGAKLLPAALSAVGAFNSFATWVERNQTTAKALAGVVAGLATAVFAVAAAQRVAAAASAIWTGAMWLLNAAFLANPIGAIVLGVAALAAAFVLAWQKSETFRQVVVTVLNAVKDGFATAAQFVLNAWFTVYGGLVDAAAKAFGWIPGIGGKLKGAAEQFHAFADNANAWLQSVKDRDITLTVHTAVTASDLRTDEGNRGRARDAAAAANAAAATVPIPKISFPPTAVAPVSTKATKVPKAAAIKEAKKTGREILDAFLSGMSSSFPLVAAQVQEFSDHVATHLGHGLDRVVASAEKHLKALQAARDAVAERLSKATDALGAAREKLRDYSTSVRGAINDLGDLGTHGGATFEVIRDRLQQTLTNARDFAATIAGLRKAGLNDTALQQLIAAGPGLATQTGKAILQGGTKGIAQINAMQGQLDRVAKATGATVASQFFAAGVQQAQGVVAGLKSRDAVLKAQMKSLGDAVVAAIVRGLHLRTTATGLKVAGARAAGGPVIGARTYLVGERGPELFTPRTSGRITANGAAGGGAPIIVENHIEIGGEVVRVVRTEIRASNRATVAAVRAGARRAVA